MYAAAPDGTVSRLVVDPQTNAAVWESVPSNKKLSSIAAGDKGYVLGVEQETGNLVQYIEGSGWQNVKGKSGKPATGFTTVGINAAGTMVAVGKDGKVLRKGMQGVAPVDAVQRK